MHGDGDVLSQLVVIITVSIAAVLLFQWLRQSPLLGYFLAGAIIGPFGLGLIGGDGQDSVEIIAEVGIILLLFSIGIEMSLVTLKRMRIIILFGGSLQILITMAAATGVAFALNLSWTEAVFVGAAISLSSTALVLKSLGLAGRLQSAEGRATLGVLIMQDLAIVPMMIILKEIMGDSDGLGGKLVLTLLKGLAFVVFVLLVNRFVIRLLLKSIDRSGNSELFSVMALALVLGTAWLSSLAGLSLELGAFFAGLILAGSEFKPKIEKIVHPFRDAFVGIFFVSIGMLINWEYVFQNLLPILAAASAIIVGKAFFAFVAVRMFGLNTATAIRVGLNLGQVGEFAFILLSLEFADGSKISDSIFNFMLATIVITMIITPYLIRLSGKPIDKLADRFPKMKASKMGDLPELEELPAPNLDKPHILVCGVGDVGRNVIRMLIKNDVPYVGIEVETGIVRSLIDQYRYRILAGNGSDESTLKRAGIDKARALLVTHGEMAASLETIQVAKRLNPNCLVIVRSPSNTEFETLYSAGADEVVFEDFEVTAEILYRLLLIQGRPASSIREQMEGLRRNHFSEFNSSLSERFAEADEDTPVSRRHNELKSMENMERSRDPENEDPPLGR